jgi:hypothetical protein
MPILFLIIADRLDVALVCAPNHIFVRYAAPDGHVFNLETTSGAHPARLDWFRQEMPMSDRALSSGLYMRSIYYACGRDEESDSNHFRITSMSYKPLTLSQVLSCIPMVMMFSGGIVSASAATPIVVAFMLLSVGLVAHMVAYFTLTCPTCGKSRYLRVGIPRPSSSYFAPIVEIECSRCGHQFRSQP